MVDAPVRSRASAANAALISLPRLALPDKQCDSRERSIHHRRRNGADTDNDYQNPDPRADYRATGRSAPVGIKR
jgi:hypothetical protein